MLDKMMAKFSPKGKTKEPEQQEEVKQAEVTPQAPEAPEALNPAKVQEWADKLVGYVYDEELAQELASTFAQMESVEGFDKVIELLDSKEKQIEAITTGSSAAKSTPEDKGKQASPKVAAQGEEDESPDATEILKQRYAKK